MARPDTHGTTAGTAERRHRNDRRRRHPLLPRWRFAFGGSRRGARRDGDLPVTDWYEPQLLFVAVGILLLSATDAALTLGLLRAGVAREANPFMRSLLEHDVQMFVNVKTLITATAMMVLVPAAHVRVLRRFHVRRVLDALFGLYCALIAYELVLLAVAAGWLFG